MKRTVRSKFLQLKTLQEQLIHGCSRLFSLINENFDTRLSIYGKDALGSANLEMIDIARRHGSCAKFSGSGGAIFGMCLDEKKKACFCVFW